MRALLIFLSLLPVLAVAAEPLRIQNLQRCGDLLERTRQTFCLTASGLDATALHVWLDDREITAQRNDQQLSFELETATTQSAALYLQQGPRRSNGVWLSMAGSHVIAAKPSEVATNMDGLTTYVDLVSLIIEERFDGLEQATALALKYGATVVGSIPALNTYQLRLPAHNLLERDALVLRLGTETSVDAVVIEESDAEQEEASDPAAKPPPERDEWIANRFSDAVHYYRRQIPSGLAPVKPARIRVGIIERNVDFDAPDFKAYAVRCSREKTQTCLYARDAGKPDSHGSTVAGVLAADWNNGGNTGLLRGLDGASNGFDVIVDRGSDAGVTANIAASVNLVEDGARVLNWSWGLHRVGTRNVAGGALDSMVKSGLAMSGYEELLEEFFLWLRQKHPDVVVVNSAGNGASFSGTDEYRLPSSFITDQLLVVGGHQRSEAPDMAVTDPRFVEKRASSNIDRRVDITAAACAHASTSETNAQGAVHCGTSFATPMVTGIVAAMLSINPQLTPEQLRILLRRSSLTIGGNTDFEPMDADDLTAPILPSERDHQMNHPDLDRSARLDMQQALELSLQSRNRAR